MEFQKRGVVLALVPRSLRADPHAAAVLHALCGGLDDLQPLADVFTVQEIAVHQLHPAAEGQSFPQPVLRDKAHLAVHGAVGRHDVIIASVVAGEQKAALFGHVFQSDGLIPDPDESGDQLQDACRQSLRLLCRADRILFLQQKQDAACRQTDDQKQNHQTDCNKHSDHNEPPASRQDSAFPGDAHNSINYTKKRRPPH